MTDSAELKHFFVIFAASNPCKMIIGRTKEKEKMIRAYQSDYSQFVTVYGRRRVGKTFFVKETFGYKFTFEHAGLAHTDMKGQLAAWKSSLRDAGVAKPKLPKNWLDAFDMLKDLIKASDEKKKVIFIDEMPWMDTLHSGFIPALEHFWNGWASGRKDILLIVCGSATSWIINKLIKNHGGQRGRVTAKIFIQPFTLSECERYARAFKLGMSRRQIVEAYMVMGGIPFYWSYLDRTKSLAQNIDDLVFNPNGELYDEFDALYASLFKNPEAYVQAITILGKKKAGMTREELIKEGMDDNGKLTKILAELEYCGFIRKYNTIGFKKKNAVFQLIDPYTLFYFKFIAKNTRGDKHFWSVNQNTPLYYNWCGLAFERVCFAHEEQILHALGISGVSTAFYSWRTTADENTGSGAQIDLVIDRTDGVINLCEIKFTKEPFTVNADDESNLETKIARLSEESRTDKAIHLVLISAKGLKKNEYSSIFQNIITLEDLFKA